MRRKSPATPFKFQRVEREWRHLCKVKGSTAVCRVIDRMKANFTPVAHHISIICNYHRQILRWLSYAEKPSISGLMAFGTDIFSSFGPCSSRISAALADDKWSQLSMRQGADAKLCYRDINKLKYHSSNLQSMPDATPTGRHLEVIDIDWLSVDDHRRWLRPASKMGIIRKAASGKYLSVV